MNRVYCCAELNGQIHLDMVLCEGQIPPESPKQVFMQSDGGHGGLVPINHCPFCGKKIEYREEAA